MRPHPIVPFVLLLLAALPAALSAQNRAGAVVIRPAPFTPRGQAAVDAEEGTLYVPEDWARPEGRLIELHFVRFRSTSANPGPPIVYLAGGPGGSGTAAASGDRFPLFMQLREVADVIALDQRGTGGSRPFLLCPEPLRTPLDQPAESPAVMLAVLDWSRGCAEHWRAQGVDLAAYHTDNNVEDLDALRRALGAEKLSLWGISYGTHLGLAALRRHPDRIHRAVLSGVEGPAHTLKLPSVLDRMLAQVDSLVRADSTAAGVLPDPLGSVRRILERLATPVTVDVPGANGGAPTRVTVGRDDFRMALLEQMAERDNVARLPAILRMMEGGDFSLLARGVMNIRGNRWALAMSFAMDCASGATAARVARIAAERETSLMGDAPNFFFPAVCAAWPHRELGDGFRGPVVADVPVLFVSGTLDARTPPSNAEEVLPGFRNGVHLVIEGAGHDDDLFLSSPEIGRAMADFLAGGPLAGTRITLPPIEFTARFP